MASPAHLIVGRIRKAHGIHGEVLVEPLTDSPDTIFAPRRVLLAGDANGDLDEDGATVTVRSVRPFKKGLLVALDELPDRTTAEPWRDRYLLVSAADLPPLDPGEVYVHDIVGMHVVLATGEPLGTVRETYELPQGLMLDVERAVGGSVLLPFRPEIVRSVDRNSRHIVVEPPLGLIE